MMTNVMMKTSLNQKIIKISNLIHAMKNSVCPKAKVIWRPNFSESRICPNIYRMFRSVDWTHDLIIVKWKLFIWHERKLCALTNAPPVQSTKMGRWLSTLFHANCSAAQVYVLHPGQFIFALSCRRRSFLRVLGTIRFTEPQRDGNVLRQSVNWKEMNNYSGKQFIWILDTRFSCCLDRQITYFPVLYTTPTYCIQPVEL